MERIKGIRAEPLNQPPLILGKELPQKEIVKKTLGIVSNSSGPFENGQKPIQCFMCKGWGHPRRLCPSCLNYTRGGMAREPPSPAREDMRQPPPSNPDTCQ